MYFKREMNAFLEAKETYNAFREFERKKIINYLIEKGLKIQQNGGMGHSHYTNGGQLERSYDLTNWKWVSGSNGEKKFFISLQAFDKDRSSKNYHVLMDRIGICFYNMDEKKPDYFHIMKVTSLELPLNENDLEDLYGLIRNNGHIDS